MKNVLRIFLFLVIAILGYTAVQAQAVKFHLKEPPSILQNYIQSIAGYDKNGSAIYNIDFNVNCSGTLYGCGNASSVSAYFIAEGTATTICFNGGNDPGPVPGQTNFKIQSETKTFDATNGHAYFNLDASLFGSCKGGGNDWHHEVTNVNISTLYVVVNGVKVDLTKYL